MIPVIQTRRESPLTKMLTGFGTGLGEGLQEGINQFQERQATEEGLISVGINPEKAKGIARLSPALQKLALGGASGIAGKDLAPLFTALGMPAKKAETLGKLFSSAGLGGQTEILKVGLDMLQRGEKPQESALPQEAPESDISQEAASSKKGALSEIELTPKEMEKNEEARIEKILSPLEQDTGLLPKERVKRENALLKDNTGVFKELNKSIINQRGFKRDFDILTRLNERGNLPKGIFKGINLDLKEGKLKWPAISHPDAQQYVKTVNSFIKRAREFFPGRVTNFDLESFMTTLPTLANSPEGRRVIIEQMRIANDIMQTHDEALKKVYDKYKLKNIDVQQAEQKADEIAAPKIQELEKLYQESTLAHEKYVGKKNVPAGHKLMIYKGELGYVPDEKVKKALSQGAELR